MKMNFFLLIHYKCTRNHKELIRTDHNRLITTWHGFYFLFFARLCTFNIMRIISSFPERMTNWKLKKKKKKRLSKSYINEDVSL